LDDTTIAQGVTTTLIDGDTNIYFNFPFTDGVYNINYKVYLAEEYYEFIIPISVFKCVFETEWTQDEF
jgi:hypothetical protein